MKTTNEILHKVREVCRIRKVNNEDTCQSSYDFVSKYVNDHNRVWRWLRGVFFSETEKLRIILETMCAIESIVHLEHLLLALDFNSTDPSNSIYVSANCLRIECEGGAVLYWLDKSIEQNLNENESLRELISNLIFE